MTPSDGSTPHRGGAVRPRSDLELAAQQLRAIDRFHAARLAAEGSDGPERLEVVRREHAALVARAHAQLRATGDLLAEQVPCRAVLAHRSPWFAEAVAEVLRDGGIEVLAGLDDGADLVGTAVAEQPDLVLIDEDLGAERLVREVREYCPSTLVAAQVSGGARVGALLDAGAATVFTRQVPPAEVGLRLRELLSA